MKKFLLSFLAFLCFAGLSAQSNLILNGDFEDWDFMTGSPKNWTLNFSAWPNKSTDAQSGSYSAELEASDYGTGFISSAKFDIVAGKTYTCTFYSKVGTGTLTKFEATLRHFDGVFPEAVVSKSIPYPVTGWTKFEFTYTAETSRNVDLQFLFWTDDNAKVLIDNVTFAEGGTSGIYENSASDVFEIYADYVVVRTGQSETISVYNTNGLLLNRVSVNEGGQVDMSHLPTGVYVISVEGKSISTKFFKK